MDKIVIKDMEIYAYHGVHDFEKAKGQRFFVSVDMELDLREAGLGDDLGKTVNYAETAQLIREVMTGEKFNLIESCAERVAAEILNAYEQVKKVKVRVAKPDAPMDVDFDNVYCEITRKKHVAYLGIGSNLGDKEGYLDFAVEQLSKDDYIKVTAVSSYIETEPVSDVEQDDYLNGCIEIETLYLPEELLKVTQDIENSAGRKRIVHWGPRTLDIDILLYDSETITKEKLLVPHPYMAERSFVLEPLVEIAPYAWHPVLKKTAKKLLEDLNELSS